MRNAAHRVVRLIRYLLRHPEEGPEAIRVRLKRPPHRLVSTVIRRLRLDPGERQDNRFEDARDAIAYARRHRRPRSSAAWYLAGLEEIRGAIRYVSA